MILTKEAIKELARETLAWPESRTWSQKLADTKCRGFFGAPTHIIADLWNRLDNNNMMESGSCPKHLLCGMLLGNLWDLWHACHNGEWHHVVDPI